MFTIAVKFKDGIKESDIAVILKEYDATVISIVNGYHHIRLSDEVDADEVGSWIATECVVEKVLWPNGTRIRGIVL